MSFMKLFSGVVGFLGLTLICALPSRSATVGVEIRDPYYFTPTNVVINPRDRVVWVNLGIRSHDTLHTGVPPLWDSPSMNTNATFGFTFTNLGYYPYRCQQHVLQGPFQTGSVTVVNISLASLVKTPTNAQFTINGGRQGLKAVVEAGQSLSGLSPIATNTFPASGSLKFTNNSPPPTNRFYRARVIP
jgi:plastocyanin